MSVLVVHPTKYTLDPYEKTPLVPVDPAAVYADVVVELVSNAYTFPLMRDAKYTVFPLVPVAPMVSSNEQN